ncbi:MAG: hypothetical protein Q9162_003545 [Coniocarpon cinnabarinum]
MAAAYPDTTFIGVDINPPITGELSTTEHNNVQFVKANVDDDWTFLGGQSSVDYILARMLTTGVRNWQGMFDKAYHALRPGGFLESQETAIELLSNGSATASNSPLMKWFDALARFAQNNGVETHSVDHHGQRLKSAGFEIISEKPIKWYFDADDPQMAGKERISHMVTEQIEGILDTMTPKVFAKSPEDGPELARAAKIDLKENSAKSVAFELLENRNRSEDTAGV